MSGQLSIWEIPLSENSRTWTTERHGDLTMTVFVDHFPVPSADGVDPILRRDCQCQGNRYTFNYALVLDLLCELQWNPAQHLSCSLPSQGRAPTGPGLILHAHNEILFSRGLRLCSATVIAGILLGNLVGGLSSLVSICLTLGWWRRHMQQLP